MTNEPWSVLKCMIRGTSTFTFGTVKAIVFIVTKDFLRKFESPKHTDQIPKPPEVFAWMPRLKEGKQTVPKIRTKRIWVNHNDQTTGWSPRMVVILSGKCPHKMPEKFRFRNYKTICPASPSRERSHLPHVLATVMYVFGRPDIPSSGDMTGCLGIIILPPQPPPPQKKACTNAACLEPWRISPGFAGWSSRTWQLVSRWQIFEWCEVMMWLQASRYSWCFRNPANHLGC